MVLESYNNREIAKKITQKIHEYADFIEEDLIFMHVCGSHEWTISHNGVRSLLPSNVDIRPGPGCPVCITPVDDIDNAIKLAQEGKTILVYGDMSRSKGSKGQSLLDVRALGCNIKIVYSIQDAILNAKRDPTKEFIFFGVGFDTTSPPTAFEVLNGLPKNLSLIISYRYMPPIVGSVLKSSVLGIDGVINPGHSSTITGMMPYYQYFLETRKPQVFCGFEPVDLLLGILMLLRQIKDNSPRLENEYQRSVTWEGNKIAQEKLEKVFDLDNGHVRGVATIPKSGFTLKEKYKDYDSYVRYGLSKNNANENFVVGARCGEVILGLCEPVECPLYMKECTSQKPKGPTMVSLEGTCRIWAEHSIISSIKKIKK
ncbi:MAG: hydrogenase formation protein HypD [Nitrososphaeraceae archaeon]|nr:hydrogenase formation protein HypD [Nitrososphaeraceae archaeon]